MQRLAGWRTQDALVFQMRGVKPESVNVPNEIFATSAHDTRTTSNRKRRSCRVRVRGVVVIGDDNSHDHDPRSVHGR